MCVRAVINFLVKLCNFLCRDFSQFVFLFWIFACCPMWPVINKKLCVIKFIVYDLWCICLFTFVVASCSFPLFKAFEIYMSYNCLTFWLFTKWGIKSFALSPYQRETLHAYGRKRHGKYYELSETTCLIAILDSELRARCVWALHSLCVKVIELNLWE